VVEFWLSALSLYCEVIVVWFSAISLLYEMIVVVRRFLCRGSFVGERSCVLLVYICQIFSGGSLRWRSCVDV